MTAGGGWFAVYRSVFEKYEGKPEALAAWLWILSRTRYESDGDLERGEVRISTRGLARQMGWSHGKARRFILRLIRGGEIRHANRPGKRHTLANAFYVVRYRELQPSKTESGTPTGTPTGTLVRKKKAKKENGVAVAPKSEGGDAVRTDPPATKKKPAARKSRSEQRDYLADEIRKSEAGK